MFKLFRVLFYIALWWFFMYPHEWTPTNVALIIACYLFCEMLWGFLAGALQAWREDRAIDSENNLEA